MICSIFFFSILNCVAIAEEQAILDALPLEDLIQFAKEQKIDIMEWIELGMRGEISMLESVSGIFQEWRKSAIDDFRGIISALIIPASVLLVLKLVLPGSNSSQKVSLFVCRVSCISALASAFIQMRDVAEKLLLALLKCSEILTPIMFAAISLAGGESASIIMKPVAAFCAEIIQKLLVHWGIILSSAAAVIAVAGNLSENISLKRLHDLFCHILNWGAGGLMAGFMAILSIQGHLSAGRDSVAARTARYAIEGIIPVVGGNVSDSLDAILSTAYIVKNAIGISGLALLVTICIVPILQLLSFSLFLKVVSAITEPLGDKPLTAITGQFANCMEMLLVISITAAVLCALLIGSCMSAAGNVVR